MALYIEYAILDNMAFNYALLLAVSLTLRLKATWWRIVLISTLGCACSLILAVSDIQGVLLIAIKIALGITMGSLLTIGKNGRKTLYSILLFTAYTFVLGGIMVACLYGASGYAYTQTALLYQDNLPLGVYLLALLLMGYTVFNIVMYIKNARKNTRFSYRITFTLLGKSFDAEAFLDSGNCCEKEGIPVCFVTDVFLQKNLLALIATNALDKQGLLVKIDYSTLAGNTSALAVKVDMVVCERAQQVLLAFCPPRKEDYSVILNARVEGLI